jgi:flagellar P-ring protein FlgI
MILKTFSLLLCLLLSSNAFAEPTRLKDLITIKGVRENPIIGYGLVIGLNGTGDGGGDITNQSLKRMFEKLGLNPQREIASKNVAAVIVTAKLPAFARVGQKIDVTISSVGDSNSLAGGTLLVTPLKGGDGKVYALASGAVSIGGLNNGKGFATTAMIPSGAIVESEIETDFHEKKSLRLSLNHADFTTAARIEKTLNEELGGKYASARDSATIDLIVPTYYERRIVPLVSIIENFRVHQDLSSKIVINERTGTVVAGGDIRVKDVAISHRNLTIQVGGGGGQGAQGGGGEKVHFIEQKTTLNDLVKGLNALGANPEDLITIFQTLRRNGALTGEIELI